MFLWLHNKLKYSGAISSAPNDAWTRIVQFHPIPQRGDQTLGLHARHCAPAHAVPGEGAKMQVQAASQWVSSAEDR